MANQHQQSDPPEFTPDDEIDKVLGHANPNPTRSGCPPRDVQIALARRQRPIEDPAYQHLTKCSPCYRELRAFQTAATQEQRTRTAWLAAVAALVLVAGGAAWYLLSPRGRVAQPSESAAPHTETVRVERTELDLRKYVVMRSESGKQEQQPLSLTRDRLNLTILLAVGSEPGSYEVQILDSELKSRASASGSADIRNYVTTLQATIDLHSLPAGAYQLALRHEGEDWHLYPAKIQ